MGTQDDKLDTTLFSTRDNLLINNTAFPALELYSAEHDLLGKAYVNWLKSESLGKCVCYIDLTFEIPLKSIMTLSIVPSKENLYVYQEILQDYISSEHTLYPHSAFKEGILGFTDNNGTRKILQTGQDRKNLECSESFFLHEIKKNSPNVEAKENLGFFAEEIKLEDYYNKAREGNKDYFKNINDISIKEHWENWVELHENLHKKKQSLISNAGGMLKWILVVPLGFVPENGNYKNIGSIFLGMDNNCNKDEVIYFTRSLVLLLLSSSQRYYAKIALKNSIKSAVSAIMSRNMSHNLGSHVLSNIKGELDDIGKIFKDSYDSNNNIPFKSENLFGLKWFINYLQERQDFIATIGGFENQTFMPVNFKTFVFDGLLPDHQFKRHSPSSSLNAHKNYLLEYIIKSENIQRDRIIIKFKSFDSSIHSISTDIDYKNLTQLNVSFPGGIVGRQAFFSIFENIIRNAAKHSEIKEKLEITIDTPSDGNYDTIEYIKLTLTDNLQTFKFAESNLKKALSEPVFNESQEKQGNKGIKEMKISAAWLRGIRLEDIDSYIEELDEKGFIRHPKILDITDFEGSIRYAFYLLKPKELLIYLNSSEINELKLTEDEKQSLNKNGIDIITPEYFQDRKNYNLRHSLFVIQQENEYEKDTNIEKVFNQRRLEISTKSLLEIFNTNRNEPRNIIAEFWKVYLGLDKKPMPLIDIRPSNIESETLFEKFRAKLNADESYSNDSDIKLLFNHHNDTENTFNTFRSEHSVLFDKLQFLEGISGGNSTELLISRTEKSELFYYRLLQSCVTDVVIIDERLWNNNSKTNITELAKILDEKIPLFNQEILTEINLIEDKNKWAKAILEKLNIANKESLLGEVSVLHDDREKITCLDVITKDILNVEIIQKQIGDCRKENEFKYWLYKKKNIEVLNILFDNTDQQKFELYNLNLLKIGKNSNYGKLILDAKLLKLNNYPHKIVSIHQGIIDKIQNHLNNQERLKSKNAKTISNAIEIIDEAFPVNNYIRIIHSGRGKPSVEIPKGFHFIPYASLESAFYDCKFSLTDLLFNAKTEL